jgi:putative RecB family exonuclease
MVASLSPSSMATWHQCPKRFFFEKILRIETETTEPAVCGSFVHLVLEQLMGRSAQERTPEIAREIATATWPSFITDPDSRFAELGLDVDATKAFKRRAWAGVTGYFRIEDPTRVDVVGTEEEVRADLGGAPVYGIIDRVDRGPDGLVVTDYKSGKAPSWEDERQEKLAQLRTYAAMLEANGRRVTELRLLFVSPQLAAAAKLDRCEAEVLEATARLAAVVPGRSSEALARGLLEVETAHRHAREAAPDREAARLAATLAAEAAAQAVAESFAPGTDPATTAAVVALVLDAFAARRKAFFARRSADAARPTTVTLQVREEDLEQARSEAIGIWAEATACYEAWDFPGRTGALCDWCPFSGMCETFQAWDAAGRPDAEPAAALAALAG